MKSSLQLRWMVYEGERAKSMILQYRCQDDEEWQIVREVAVSRDEIEKHLALEEKST
jgi:hypothetical protein